ncbi:MAG: YihY/virulence factor BrkB family protein [Armatimonadetes bacterium]|nr:YihY/virulence factor BrkB family protein [Armatimonadota bacterium]
MVDRIKALFRVLREIVTEYLRDDGPFLAAGIAFYAFFSLFPLALISIAILAHILPSDTEAVRVTFELAGKFEVPPDVIQFIGDNFRTLAEDRRRLGMVGLIMLLWSGRQLFRAMELSLHKAWDIPLRRHFVAGNLLSMLLVLLCAAVTFAVGLISAFLSWVQVIISRADLPEIAGFSLAEAQVYSFIQTWFVVPGATAMIFLLLYIILPSRQVPVGYAIPGAFFSAVAWKLSSWIYLRFVVAFGSKSPIYGSIWGIIGLMIWLYIAASVFLLGAEVVYVGLRDRGATARKRR